tara:strand:- start:1944 stop:2048 length:105 start_codon:yes stop_codon:yes gene_type:complete
MRGNLVVKKGIEARRKKWHPVFHESKKYKPIKSP